MQHGELRSDRGFWFINEFFLKLAFFNIHDTFKVGNWSSHVFLKLVCLTTHDIFNCVKWKCGHTRTVRPVPFRHSGMAARVQRKSCGWQSSWTQRLTRQFFSWIIFRAYACEVRIWVNTVFILTSRKTEIARSVRGPKLQGLRAEDAMAEPCFVQKNFGDLITADHKVLSEGCESQNNHRFAVVVQDLATQWIQAYPCKNKNFSGNTQELAKVLGADQETKSHFHKQFLGIWQSLWRSLLESLYVGTTQIGD